MRNRLIAAILGLFGTLTGVQAAPDVTSEITYDLASGRADYYFWKDEASAGNNGYMWYECSWICPYISRHLLSLNPLQARCRRYSRGER